MIPLLMKLKTGFFHPQARIQEAAGSIQEGEHGLALNLHGGVPRGQVPYPLQGEAFTTCRLASWLG